MNHARALALLLAAAGCATEDPDGGADAADATPDRAGNCVPGVAPVAEPPWLAAFLADHVASLAATPRASVAQRAATRDYLRAALQALGFTPETYPYDAGANVGAVLAATVATDRWIVVGAHFDSVTGSPGANDNATGVAVVLAAARALAAQECRTANVAFTLFDQEEVGLIGSGVYAAALRAAGTNVVAAHTIDQAGWDADDDLTFEIERPTPGLFDQYLEASDAVGARVVETAVGSTDHESFRQQGFAAAGVTEEYVSGDTTPFYHQAGDTAATVDGVYHRVAARMMMYLLARATGASAP